MTLHVALTVAQIDRPVCRLERGRTVRVVVIVVAGEAAVGRWNPQIP